MTFNYAARDYDSIKTDLLARASRVLPEWTDRDPSDFGMLLVDLWAYMGDIQHYYIDRAATEAFLNTATKRESVLAIANLLDYRPVGRASATGTVTVENTTATDYLVPQYTKFTARSNDKTYDVYAKEAATITASNTGVVTVGEGDIIEDEILTESASGLSNQTYLVSSEKCAPATLRVFVYEDGITPTEYDFVSDLGKADSGARVFTTQLGADNFVEVLFGSTVSGYVPPTGATITATYAACSGLEGNLPANAVVDFETSPGAGISTVASSALSGGSNEESIASMKDSIPSVIAAQDRAVTQQDFINLAVSIPGVAKAAMEYTPGTAGTVQSVVTASILSGTATVEVTAHGYSVGDAIRVEGVGTDFNGNRVITSVPTANTFQFVTDGADQGPIATGTVFLLGNATAKIYAQETRTDYLDTGDTSQTVDTDLRTLVEETIQEKALLGTTVTTAATIAWQEIDVTVTVNVNPRAVQSRVVSEVATALDELFEFDNVHFGQLLHLGQVHRIVLNVSGVDYCTVTKFSTGASQVDDTIQIPVYQLPKKGTVTITPVGGISV